MRPLRNFTSYLRRQYLAHCNTKLLRVNTTGYYFSFRCYGSYRVSNNILMKNRMYNNMKTYNNDLKLLYNQCTLRFTTESSSSDIKLPIIITDASCDRLNFLKKKRNENDLMLRVGVSSGGCSGFQYEFEFANHSDIEDDEDVILTKNDAQFVIDKTSMRFIKGAKLDFVSDFIQTSFVVIDNPNIVSECGCNVSFTPSPQVMEHDDDDDDDDDNDDNDDNEQTVKT